MLTWLLVIVASVAVDQLTKRLAVACLMEKGSVEVIPGVLRFTYVENDGAAFGMLSEHRWIFMVISTVAIVAMLVYLWKFRPDNSWACTGISLIIGGGIGNMIDRVYLDYVIDFIDFCAFPNLWMWVFNVADACVCVGAGILCVWCVVSLIQETRTAKKAKEPSDVKEGSDETNETI
ncbi:MAG: signal peptidase II [Clostridia bacterium]|nr:signal peptidase II [Clostridia bacterium]